MSKNLREQKREIANKWEECFEKKLEDVFTEKGFDKFWSNETSCEDALIMLDKAAINLAFGSIGDCIGGIAIVVSSKHNEDEKGKEPCKVKHDRPFRVARVEDGKIIQLYDDEYETEDAARAYIQNIVNCSSLTLNDFAVTQVKVL